MNPYRLISEFREPRLLNFAGEGGGQGAGSQSDGTDEPVPDSPAGKKWAKLREEKKAAEELAQQEREQRIAAEARAKAFDDWKAQFDGTKKKPKSGGNNGNADDDEQPVQINPDDEKIVATIFQREMKKLGLDQIPEVVTKLQEQTQSVQATNALERAKQELTAEFSESVPFNYEEALKFAKERGYGMTFTNVKEALRVAHKEMNEKAFIEHWQGGAQPKKKVPKMAASGRSADDVIEIPDDDQPLDPKNINSLEDARRAAKEMFQEEGV